MKFKELSTISFKNFIRDKKNIISIILIGLMFALVILCFSFRESLNNYWDESIGKLVDYRTYVVSVDKEKYKMSEAIKKLKSYNHVVEVFDETSYLISMKVQDNNIVSKDNGILLVGTISDPIKLVDGNNLDSVSKDENPIICAKQFYPYLEYEQKDYLKSKTIDITNKVGKDLNLSFIMSNEKEKFKIVGLYDAKENHTEGNVCYTKLDVVSKLNKKYQPEVFSQSDTEVSHVYMVIDNVDNENLVLNKIRKEGFDISNPTLRINKDMGNNIISLMIIISGIILLLTIAIIIFLSVKKINKRKVDYSIMKTTGYSDMQIISTYILELILEFIFSFICSILLYIIIRLCFQKLYISDKIVFYNLKIGISYVSICINIILSIFISILMTLYFRHKIKKIPIKTMVK